MLVKIDSEKTISKNKICFSSVGITDFVNMIVMYGIGVFMLPVIAIVYEFNHFDTITEDIFCSIFSILIPLVISSFIFFKLYTRNDLKRFSNIDNDLIIKAVNELKWEFESSNKDYMVIKAGTWQRQISVIYDKGDILIHSLRFGKFDFYLRETSRLEVLMRKIDEIKK